MMIYEEASGCIWKASAIKSIQRVLEVKKHEQELA